MCKDHTGDERNLAILIVDDDSISLNVMVGLLAGFGETADCFKSGKAAIDAALNKKYDLLFVDYLMPKMDGFEVVEKIRNSGGPSATATIVLVTGHVEKIEEAFLISKGIDFCLKKPIVKNELQSIIVKAGISFAKNNNSEKNTDAFDYLNSEELKDSGETVETELYEEITEQEKNILDYLSDNGFDVETGILFAGKSIIFYQEVLKIFATKTEENIAKLVEYKKLDLKLYEKFLEESKIDAKNMGATELYNILLKHIIALNIDDKAWIEDNFEILKQTWRSTAKKVENIVKM